MSMYDSVIRGTIAGAKGLARGIGGFARATPGGFMVAGGALAGGIAAVAQGDNYSSTDLARNIIGGAAAGAGIGLAARGLFSRTAVRGASRFLGISQARKAVSGTRMAAWGGSPLGKLLGGTRSSARGVIGGLAGIGSFMVRHPAIALSGAAVGIGMASIHTPFTTEQEMSSGFSMEGRSVDQMTERRDFQNSASGIMIGLNQRRHR